MGPIEPGQAESNYPPLEKKKRGSLEAIFPGISAARKGEPCRLVSEKIKSKPIRSSTGCCRDADTGASQPENDEALEGVEWILKHEVADNRIDQFIGKVELGRDFFIEAGELLVKLIDEEPGICERMIALNRGCPWLTMDVLKTFESIGRKQLAVEAMFLPRHVLNRLITLPVAEQRKIAEKPIPVIREGSHPMSKPASKLTWKEAAIAIGPKGVRTIEEQKATKETWREPAGKTINLSDFELRPIAERIVKRLYPDSTAKTSVVLIDLVEDELRKSVLVPFAKKQCVTEK